MNIKELPKLKIGDIEAEIPIIQGGMGVAISLSGLASAVANQGAIGVISATGLFFMDKNFHEYGMKTSKKILTQELKNAREKSSGIIGVNILVALTDYEDLLVTAYEEGADLIFLGAGLPLKFSSTISINKLKKILKKIVPIVSSTRAAGLICKIWQKKFNLVPNAFVLEGPAAGGHLGFKIDDIDKPENSLENILPQVKKILQPFEKEYNKTISVIVAGGIFTGKDIYKYLNLGAQGVKMGTRFVATEECDASKKFKEEYVNSSQDDIIIINSPVGLPGRAIKNQFLTEVMNGQRKPFRCPWKCLKTCDAKEAPYCIALALYNAKIGNMTDGFSFAGSNAYRIKEITTVKEVFNNLKNEFKIAVKNQ